MQIEVRHGIDRTYKTLILAATSALAPAMQFIDGVQHLDAENAR